MQAAPGLELPLHPRHPQRPGWWGLLATLAADVTIAVSLLFGYFFYWTVAPQWPPPRPWLGDLPLGLSGLALLAASSVLIRLGETRGGTRSTLLAALLALLASTAILGIVLAGDELAPTRHAYDAIVTACAAWQGLHLTVCLSVGLILLLRPTGPERRSEWQIAALLWHYTTLQGVLMGGALLLFPRLL